MARGLQRSEAIHYFWLCNDQREADVTGGTWFVRCGYSRPLGWCECLSVLYWLYVLPRGQASAQPIIRNPGRKGKPQRIGQFMYFVVIDLCSIARSVYV